MLLLKKTEVKGREGWHDNRHGPAIVAMIWVSWKAVCVRVFASAGGRQIEGFSGCACLCVCGCVCVSVLVCF